MDGEDDFAGFPANEAEARRLQQQQLQQQQQQQLQQQRQQQEIQRQREQQQRLEQQRLLQQQQNGPPQAPPQQQPLSNDGAMMQVVQMMQQMMQRQQEFFLAMAANAPQAPLNPERIIDSLSNSITEFRYDVDGNVTFASWYSRYEDLFTEDASRLDDDAKVRLLLRKLGISEHERYASFILPQKPGALSFAMTVEKLTSLFGAKQSVVSKRYRCLQATKLPTEDYTTYGCRINKLCVEFELSKMTEEQFKCLMFVCGLKAEGDAEIRTRLLSKIEEQQVTLQQLSEECQRLLNLKHDNEMIETHQPKVSAVRTEAGSQRDRKTVKTTKKPERKSSPKRSSSSVDSSDDQTDDTPKRPCWLCGAMHYTRDCSYKKHKCSDCSEYGHREGYCISARPLSSKKGKKKRKPTVTANGLIVNDTVQRRKYVPVGLAGKTYWLQLDTASDVTIISKQLWQTIGRPKLSPSSVRVLSASTNTLQLVGEFLCDVTIAGSTRIELIRVTERSLLLLGADLIDSFGLDSVPMGMFCFNAPGKQIQEGGGNNAPQSKLSSETVLCRNVRTCSQQLRPLAKRAPKPSKKKTNRGFTRSS